MEFTVGSGKPISVASAARIRYPCNRTYPLSFYATKYGINPSIASSRGVSPLNSPSLINVGFRYAKTTPLFICTHFYDLFQFSFSLYPNLRIDTKQKIKNLKIELFEIIFPQKFSPDWQNVRNEKLEIIEKKNSQSPTKHHQISII